MKGESCVICGAPIPEGRQVCLSCDSVHRAPLDVRSYVDENTHANVWTGYARFGAGFNDWRFAACGGVTGGTQLISTSAASRT